MLDIVERNTGASRWKHDGSREPGHQLGTIELDNATYLIEHDAMGRVTTGAGTSYAYGPRGRLIFADRNGLDESYLYDARGRLAQIINGSTRTLIHDGDQMIAAMNTGELL